jgi:hypothetical protein
MVDLNRATDVTDEVRDTLVDQYDYHPWDAEQQQKGMHVRHILLTASITIIQNVPACPDRSVALRKLREARMDCNSAITHNGKY